MTTLPSLPNPAPNVPGQSPEPSCPCAPPPTGGRTGQGHGPGPRSAATLPERVSGVGAAVANAVRQVNAAFNRLDHDAQAATDIRYDGLDREIDAAWLSGDRDRALAAIRAWRDHWLAEFARAGQGDGGKAGR